MNKFVSTYFGFAFGGNFDYGENCAISTPTILDFQEENEIGYGMAIRNNVDVAFADCKKVKAVINTENPLNVKVEFAGNNAIPLTLSLQKGENLVEIDLPEHLTEFKFFVERRLNKMLERTEMKIESLELI